MQVVLSWLPGYMWNGSQLVSTGNALPPTQHFDPETGEIKYYCRPLFRGGATVGLFVRRAGILEAIASGKV